MLLGGWPAIKAIAAFSLRESLRRRVFLVVLVLTVGFLALYALGTTLLFDEVEGEQDFGTGLELRVIAAATVFGLAMFATLFLGTVLAVFLTLGAVRGDAERGLLQPILVRPVGRDTVLAGRFLGAASVCAGYVLLVQLVAMVITGLAGDWWPDRVLGPLLGLAGAVVILTALSVLGSVLLSSTANGIAIFMVFGAGLVAGILGQIGEALQSSTLETVADVCTFLLPFEALYQDSLAQLTADTRGFTKLAISLGPFGGAEAAGWWLWPYAVLYLASAGALAVRAFRRADL